MQKHKDTPPQQKELLNLFNDLLDTNITDKTLKSKSQKRQHINVIKRW